MFLNVKVKLGKSGTPQCQLVGGLEK